MISQSLYSDLQKIARSYLKTITNIDVEVESFTHPYVLVIHNPTGRGFYLDREYRHIVDIKNCQEPKSPVEMTRQHLCASPDLPAWTTVEKPEDFDSFWLY